jgi:hypothetical protein
MLAVAHCTYLWGRPGLGVCLMQVRLEGVLLERAQVLALVLVLVLVAVLLGGCRGCHLQAVALQGKGSGVQEVSQVRDQVVLAPLAVVARSRAGVRA